jgi:CheY-like chemotaxis protein
VAVLIDIIEMSVLIADDMPNMISTLRKMMKFLEFGSRFFSATNGEEAWNLLQKEAIDFAIIDLNMPIMNGAEILNRVREDRNLRDLPIMMVTAQANMEFVAEAAESEIDAYILKPVTVKVLGDKILNVIDNANNPSPMVYHLKEARQYEDHGDIDAAIEEAHLAVDANPASSRPPRELGYYYMQKTDFKSAEKWLLKAAKMNSVDVIAFHHLGELYIKRNDIKAASEYFDKAMRISPRHVARAVYFGTTLLERGMLDRAVQVFEKALSLSAADLQLQEEIAGYCLEKGAKEYGAKLLESILRKNPKRTDLLFPLGTTLEELGEYSRALSHLNRAEREDSENLDVKLHIASVYLAMGKAIRAEKPLKEILEANPEHEEAKKLFRKCT